ncbi:translocation and assembly module TamB [Paucibacter oligotrophus]|uniref:Translocation and assembly module TamB n=1 Tax=Roseateles oligotrophus TaxID=1769250 RepID=A0A840LA41_9BURK|nr:translocation/assembly module TamB domain-containing protein [Roseateles oligotrophus]MBB4842237.1 translocation and assembly module TamB [Roseateles oligotrophus]
MSEQPTEASASPAPIAAAKKRGGGRGLILALLAAPLLLGAGATSAWWALATEPGTAWLLNQVPGLEVEAAKGSLLGDFSARRLRYSLPGDLKSPDSVELQGLQWQGLSLAWSRSPRLWADVYLPSLQIQRLTLKLKPSAEPTQAPSDLLIPVGLRLAALSIQELHSAELGDKPLRELRASLALSAEQGQQHSLKLEHLAWDLLQVSGEASLQSAGELRLSSALQIQSLPSAAQGLPAWTAQVQASGPLPALQLQAKLDAQAQALDAQARLAPFAAWPLQELRLNTRNLDLAALVSGLPRTAFSGTAQIRAVPDAKQQLSLAVSADLGNGLAGRWDEQRLPLRKLALDLSLLAQDPASLQINSLDALLGSAQQPAGRLRATGSNSSAQGAKLHLALEALRGEGLLQALRPLRASGKIELGSPQGLGQIGAQDSAPLSINAKLDGQWQDLAAPAKSIPTPLPLSLALQAQASSKALNVQSLKLSSGEAQLNASAELLLAQAGSLTRGWTLKTEARAQAPDLRPYWRGEAGSAWQQNAQSLDAELSAQLQSGATSAKAGLAQQAPLGSAQLQLKPGSLGGVASSGLLRYEHRAGAAPLARLDLQLDSNQLQGRAELLPGEQLQAALELRAPQLAGLQALLASFAPKSRLAGSLMASLKLTAKAETPGKQDPSGWNWRSEGNLQASKLLLDSPGNSLQLAAAQGRWELASGLDAPLQASLDLEQLQAGGFSSPKAGLSLAGSWAKHRLQLNAQGEGKIPAALIPPGQPKEQIAKGPLTLSLQGALSGTPGLLWYQGGRWQFEQGQLLARPQEAQLQPWLQAGNLAGGLSLGPQAQLQQAAVKPGRLELLGAGLRWAELAWHGGDQASVDLQLEPLAVAPLLARWQPDFGWGGDLVVGGHARIATHPRLDVEIALERSGGDLSVTDDGGTQKLNLSELRIGLIGSPGVWHLTQALAGSNVGALAGALTARNSDGSLWPSGNSQLQGVLEAQVANLSTWGAWVPTGWRMGGGFHASASFGGLLRAPEINGSASAAKLALRNPLMGVDMRDGELALNLHGGRATLESFKVRAGDGELSGSGSMQLGATPKAEIQLEARKFAVLRRVDRRLAINGQLQLLLDAQALDLQGKLDVEDGLFDFSRGNAPELGADVQVRRPGAKRELVAEAPKSRRAIKVKVGINLGQKLRVRGHGIDTLLAGDLALSQAATGPALHGVIKTVDGSFDAYGQKLTVEKGLISFSGVIDNPRLDVLALRPMPNEEVKVGVAVTGTAQAPRVKLYSDPEMMDSAKLSWLLLGRAPDQLEGGDSALLQSAAMALLAGDGEGVTSKLKKTVGLDELAIDGKGSDVKGTVVRVGKNLSERWYVGYERGLNATTGVWQVIYRIAQRFTLRAQSGDENAVDLIWQWKWE